MYTYMYWDDILICHVYLLHDILSISHMTIFGMFMCFCLYRRKDAFVGSEIKQEGLQLELASLLYNIG